MACSSPLSGWYSATRNETGKRSIVFDLKEALVDRPVQIPCGKCLSCKADQALMWSVRAYHESTLHDLNCFITLTYDDDHLPKDGKISKEALQKFFKRLRKDIDPVKLRYIACGEYGEESRRPHYHAILFGVDFLHDKITVTDQLYTSPTLSKSWPYGFVTIAPVTMSSICYVCGYVLKKMQDDETFNLMSRRPGIGHNWLDKYADDIRRTGTVTIEGREYAVPPRYLVWKEEEFKLVKEARARYAQKQARRFDPVEARRRVDARLTNRRALVSQRKEKI